MSSSEGGAVEGDEEGGDDGDGSDMAVVVEGEVTRSAQALGGNEKEVEVVASGNETRYVLIFLVCGREREGWAKLRVCDLCCVFYHQLHTIVYSDYVPSPAESLKYYNSSTIKHDYSTPQHDQRN